MNSFVKSTTLIKYSQHLIINPKTFSVLILLSSICISVYYYILTNKADITFDYDLIIVGSGLAGLTAAIEANFVSNSKLKILLETRVGS